MKTANQWLSEYAESHQNETNINIHTICVPAIYFSIVGILMTVNIGSLLELEFQNPIFTSLATLIFVLVHFFYARLSIKIFTKMLLFTLLCLVGNYYLAMILPLLKTNIIIFIVAWIGQFYGHKVEGKKPSFFKDLQFLLIGPVWVFEKLFK
tara:strand:+ start:965 stop:1420 length:456 start_codon:yes stop_codon:yes gene_type:complete